MIQQQDLTKRDGGQLCAVGLKMLQRKSYLGKFFFVLFFCCTELYTARFYPNASAEAIVPEFPLKHPVTAWTQARQVHGII